MAVNARVHDPLYNFETHFPERLSRLHLNPEFSGGGGGSHPVLRKKKNRARQGIRYKTQPITFDEIQEVDEEKIKEEEKDKNAGSALKTQFTAFSRSMEGLVPKPKHKLSNDTIEESADEPTNDVAKPVKPRIGDIGRIYSDSPELRLRSMSESHDDRENKENEPENGTKPEMESVPLGLPPSGPNTRRLRTTAKAKKRQMQAEVQGGGDKGT